MKSNRSCKKAETNSLNTIIGILIATACVMIIFYVGDNVYGALTGRNNGISNNFQMFADKINSVKPGEAPATATFYLTRGYSAVGFNKDRYPIKYDCGMLTNNKAVDKPINAACKDSACICICRKNGDCTHPYECRSITGVDNIFFNPVPKYFFDAGENAGNGMHYFYIQTTCVLSTTMTASTAFSVEKKTEGSGTNLYIKAITASS
jgi:hypothetical protein